MSQDPNQPGVGRQRIKGQKHIIRPSWGDTRSKMIPDTAPAPYILGKGEQSEDDITPQLKTSGKALTTSAGQPVGQVLRATKPAAQAIKEAGQTPKSPVVGNELPTPAIPPPRDAEATVVAKVGADAPPGDGATKAGAKAITEDDDESKPSVPPAVVSTTDPGVPQKPNPSKDFKGGKSA